MSIKQTQATGSAGIGSVSITGNVAVTNAGLTNIDVALSTRTKPADQQHVLLDANSGVDIGKLTANQSVNTAQVNAVTVLTGTGATGTGSQRVTVAVDSATVAGSASLPAGTNGIGKLTANSGVTIGAVEIAAAQTLATVTTVSTLTNQSQEGGVAISLNAGAVDTGTRRIVQANGAGKTILSAGGSAASNGNNTLIAADATKRIKVKAFSLTTTSTTAMTCIFQDGASGTELWRVIIQAISGANAGANLATSVPDWLFATTANTLLNLNISSANAIHWSVSYYLEV